MTRTRYKAPISTPQSRVQSLHDVARLSLPFIFCLALFTCVIVVGRLPVVVRGLCKFGKTRRTLHFFLNVIYRNGSDSTAQMSLSSAPVARALLAITNQLYKPCWLPAYNL